MTPPNNLILRKALQRYAAAGNEQDTVELIKLFGDPSCTVLMPVRITDPKQPPERPTHIDPELGPTVQMHTLREELPKYDGKYAALTCTVLDLMSDLLEGEDVGVVFDAGTEHAVYFRFNVQPWVVRTVRSLRAEKRAQLN